jgi:hypothetical protein
MDVALCHETARAAMANAHAKSRAPLLNERGCEALFSFMARGAIAIHMVSDFMDEDVIEVELSKVIKIHAAEIKWVCTQEYAGSPIHAIAAEIASPGSLLLPCARKEENGAKPDLVFVWHLAKSANYFTTFGRVNEIGNQGRQRHYSRKNWDDRNPCVEAFHC